MPVNNRIQRVNEDIRLVISKLLRDVKDPRIHQGIISVTHVETTGDLKFSKIYLSVLGLEDEREFKRGLKSASGWLRRELCRSLDLRNTPELIFELDNSIEHGSHILDILHDVKEKEASYAHNDEDEDGSDDAEEEE